MRGILSTPASDSRTTENNRESNKKEILTNDQHKKYNSMKHLKYSIPPQISFWLE